jgi:hypothetical protein
LPARPDAPTHDHHRRRHLRHRLRLAGNLLIVGSIADIIVVDAARRRGIAVDWRRHLGTGLPVTAATLTITAAWLGWRAATISL